MIIIDEKIVGLWFLPTTPAQDWLAVIREVEPEQKYELTYRFRYHMDDKVFEESNDKKSWYTGQLSGTRHYVLSVFRALVGDMQQHGAVGPLYEIMNDGDYTGFCRKLLDAPFSFARQVH